jgi:superfamily II DNA or RNA helicase
MMVTNSPSGKTLHEILCEEIAYSDRFNFCISFILSSGLSLIIEKIRVALQEGAHVRILTSDYLYVTQPAALKTLIKELDRYEGQLQVRVYNAQSDRDLQSFHSKGYIFHYKPKKPIDSQRIQQDAQGSIIVGSANLSRQGIKTGIEWSIYITEQTLVQKADDEFNLLWGTPRAHPLTELLLQKYTKSYINFHQTRLDAEKKAKTNSDNTASITPNEIQAEALEQLTDLHQKGVKKAAVVLATGLGKTFLAAYDFQQSGSHKLLFLAHRTDLLRQAKDAFTLLMPEIESDSEIISEGANPTGKRHVFATVQSLTSKSGRLLTYNAEFFDYIIIDEFHHAAANTYQKVVEHFQPNFLLGLTATPERPDGREVIKICDDNVAYRIDLHEAIDRGLLAPFHYFGVIDEATVNYRDFSWRQLKKNPALIESEVLKRRAEFIIEKLDQYGFDGLKRKCLGFCVTKRHAMFMADEFNRILGKDSAIHITDEVEPAERARIFARLSDIQDPLEYIFAVDVLNEGIDIPSINTIVFLRPTTSNIVFLQQLGRGLRLNPEREFLTVIDFVSNDDVLELVLTSLQDTRKGNLPIAFLRAKRTGELTLGLPVGCEVILEEKTIEVLESLKRRSLSAKMDMLLPLIELCHNLDRNLEISDLLDSPHLPTLWQIKGKFGSFDKMADELQNLIEPSNNARLSEASKLKLPEMMQNTVILFESNWQAKRIGTYAHIYGLIHGNNPLDAESFFYDRFPEWAVERGSQNRVKMFAALEEKLTLKVGSDSLKLFNAETGDITPPLKQMITDPVFGQKMIEAIDRRIHYFARYYYRERYQGVLKFPWQLVEGDFYSRAEIVNHFRQQFDPQRHEKGILKFDLIQEALDSAARSEYPQNHYAILVTLKKEARRAERGHAYTDRLMKPDILQWQTQNTMDESAPLVQDLIHQNALGTIFHLFLQYRQGMPYMYSGQISHVDHHGEKPVTFTLRIKPPLTQEMVLNLVPPQLRKELEGCPNIEEIITIINQK